MMATLTQGVWIGLHDRANETVYTWDDGSPFDFHDWSIDEPRGFRDVEEDCVEMLITPKTLGRWNDVRCHHSLPYICQLPTNPEVSARNPRFCSRFEGGGIRFLSSCYHLIQNESKSWAEAESYCDTHFRGHLATIKDNGVHMYLNFVLKEFYNVSSMWIGVKAPAKGPLVWSSGWYVIEPKWLSKEDGRHFYEGMCGLRLNSGQWDIRPCKGKYPFICEFSNEKAPPVLRTGLDGTICPPSDPDWKDLGDHLCYQFFKQAAVTWPDANFKCNQRGGTLATIYSENQLVNYIDQFMRRSFVYYHFGLYRKPNGAFAWIDGSEANFSLWRNGEPNSKKEECVEMGSEDLLANDINCDAPRAYICSIRKISADNSTFSTSECVQYSNLTPTSVVGVVFCSFLIMCLFGVFMYYYRPWEKEARPPKEQSTDLLQVSTSRSKPTEIIIHDDFEY